MGRTLPSLLLRGFILFPLSSITPFVGGIPEALQNTLQIIEFYVYIKFSIIRKSVLVAKFDFLGVLGSWLACLTRKQIDGAYSREPRANYLFQVNEKALTKKP